MLLIFSIHIHSAGAAEQPKCGTWPLPRNVRAELSPPGEAGACRGGSDRPTPPRSVRAEPNPPGAVGPCRRTRAAAAQITGRRRGTSEPSGARGERLCRAGAPEPPRLRPPGQHPGTSEPSGARRERLDRAGAHEPPPWPAVAARPARVGRHGLPGSERTEAHAAAARGR